MKSILLTLLAIVAVGGLVWASDRVTFEGERTIYTVECRDGQWDGLRCTGRLVAGDRHRFRSSKSRSEVIAWVVGSPNPSVTYTDCSVKSRGNWQCNARLGQAPPITLEMANDRATHGPAGLTVPFHAIDKWKWWLLKKGWMSFDEATY